MTLGGNGLEEISNGDNQGPEGDILAFESPGVACAVDVLMMRRCNRRDVVVDPVKVDPLEDVLGLARVSFDDVVFFFRQLSFFFEDRIWNADLAIIVQQGGDPYPFGLLFADVQSVADAHGVLCDFFTVPCGERVPGVNGGGQNFEGRVELTLLGLQQVSVSNADSQHWCDSHQQADITLLQWPFRFEVVDGQQSDRLAFADNRATDKGVGSQFFNQRQAA